MSERKERPSPSARPEARSAAQARAILARQDRIPVWALPLSYLVIIGIGYFFTFYDIADIGYAMPAISQQFNLSSGESTFVALAIGLTGYAVGSMLIGSLSDRFGRFRLLLITIGLTVAGSLLDATATGVAGIGVTGLIAGLIALLGPLASGLSLEAVSR